MPIDLVCDLKNPPIGALVVVELIKSKNPVKVEWSAKEASIKYSSNSLSCVTNNDILRALAREASSYQLYGTSPIERTQIDHWLTYCLSNDAKIDDALSYLNKCLGPLTYLVANKLTIADLAVFNEFFAKYDDLKKTGLLTNVQRWYDLISALPEVQAVLKSLPKDAKLKRIQRDTAPSSNIGDRKQEGKFVDLPGAEMGKVVVRFPPEASGFLHIGHAKAALLNQYYQQAFQGKLIMRFDDTNPAKEKEDFEKVILEDLEMLEIKPDLFTHTSQYFDLMLEYCETMLKEGKAYVDDTEPEQMKIERDLRTESKNRSNSVDKNFEMWREMVKGSAAGQKCCVRAKIDMSSPNGCMRDPTIYRCKNEPHPRTGTQYKTYPTYDFACPIVDAIENVTHTLRTMEYHDRDDQFYWFIDALKLRKPYIWEYARLNMTNTVLSKRKLTWFVEEGLVDGWDDPRFPTVRGVFRRGMTVEGLKQFIIAQGSSKSVVFMEWDKIWAFNKKVIDPVAPRYTALENQNQIVVNVAGAKLESVQVPLHPKNNDVGMKTVWMGPQVLIDYADAECLQEGENATFINWGNMMINKINKTGDKITSVDATLNLDNKDYKKTLKLTWLCKLAPSEYPPTFCVYFEHIISKAVLGRDEDFKNYIGHETRSETAMMGDPELKNLKKGAIIQLQRRGYFKVDQAYGPASEFSGVERPVVLFFVPDGHTKEMPTSGGPIKKNVAAENKAQAKPSVGQASDINEKINLQGESVRNLKAQKAAKADIDAAVKLLLELKGEYKKATGSEWKPGTVVVPVVATAKPASTGQASDINEKINLQGESVRNLKAQKAAKADIDAAVKLLLELKGEYKKATGSEWKPGTVVVPVVATAKPASTGQASDINEKINLQGESVRNLKAQKAAKADIDAAVKLLLELKGEYKKATGSEWKPGTVVVPVAATAKPASTGQASDINEKINLQGESVRNLKAQKAAKADIDAAVKLLLELKGEYKKATGSEWKPGTVVVPVAVAAPAKPASTGQASDINEKINLQGESVRNLKAQKAAKADIDAAVKLLLELKGEYKKATGSEWKPGTVVVPVAVAAPAKPASVGQTSDINEKINLQGESVRNLKAQKAAKADIDAAVKLLLELKGEYKKATGSEWKPGTVVVPVAVAAPAKPASVGQTSDINEKINLQGETVRNLKGQKAAKIDIDAAVKILLQLKGEYKTATGSDWKPSAAPAQAPVQAPAQTKPASVGQASDINEKINLQGESVRTLKAQKAAKADIDAAVKLLLELKGEYKTTTGSDWKPSAAPAAVPAPVVKSTSFGQTSDINEKINLQGESVRTLKAQKAAKADVDAAVKILLELKGEYKKATGSDWKPGTVIAPAKLATAGQSSDLNEKINLQGDTVRTLKGQKAAKADIDAAVKLLLELKGEYKTATGSDWKPAATPAPVVQKQNKENMAPTVAPVASATNEDPRKVELTNKITEQGNVVRLLKTDKSSAKPLVDAAVKLLLDLKSEYKTLTGTDFPVAGRQPSAPKAKPADKVEKKKPEPKKVEVKEDGAKKQTRLGMEATKEENLPDWYSQIITKGELIEYYDVSGCYILRPWSFGIWKAIKNWFDAEITRMGVKECYFPIFVSKAALEREKAHIADFAPEVAWVTKSGDSDLAEPIAVRPTSETVMYPAYAKWIQSYRDLPIRLNQWNNVVRWEFKHPQPFLRTREFLWQEGHTAFATAKEAQDEVLEILELYKQVYTDLMAIPVIKGRKTEKEKFAGGDFTTTVEAFISASGRAIQGATSHYLGQNFSKMFEIVFEDPETKEKQYVFQNSWGITTRTIGVMVMVHADNKGLVLPPNVACVQAVIVPCGITAQTTEAERVTLIESCKLLEGVLSKQGVRVEGDYRDNYSPGWKYNHWEVKGVPIRIELGPKDLKSNQLVAVRRDTGEKMTLNRDQASTAIPELLKTIHNSMLAKATKDLNDHVKVTKSWTEFTTFLDDKNIIMAPFCGDIPCEERIKAESAREETDGDQAAPAMGAKSLCIPFDQPTTILAADKCVHPACTNKPKSYCLFGRSY